MRALARRIARAAQVVIAAAGIVVAAAPSAAQIERFGGLQPPDLLEISGHVGKPLAGETGGWELKLGVGYSPTVYDFHLTTMRVLNSGRLPDNILFAVEPSLPNFRLIASDAELAKLAAATSADPVRIVGYRRQGSIVLMVTSLDVGATQTLAPQGSPAE